MMSRRTVVVLMLACLSGCAPDVARGPIDRGPSLGPTPMPATTRAAPSADSSPALSEWEKLDAFPLPAPKASAEAPISNDYLTKRGSPASFGDVASKLSAALDQAGYFERSFRPVPGGGFALVTRMEKISADGAPLSPGRFDPNMTEGDVRPFSLAGYLHALFSANPGYYRIIAFVVTSRMPAAGPKATTADALQNMVSRGALQLPVGVAQRPYTAQFTCTAFIYEFKVEGGSRVTSVTPSPVLGRQHLEKAGLWAALTH